MTKLALKVALATVALGLSAPSLAATNIVTNGGFENGVAPGSFATLTAATSTAGNIANWTVGSGSVDYIGTYWDGQGAGADRSVDLAGSSLGAIYQDLATVVNQAYQLTFWISKNPDGAGSTLPPAPPSSNRTGTVSFGNNSALFSYALPNDRSNMNWVMQTLVFVATQSTTRLQFASDASAGCCFGPALDTVSVVAVPEPATWAMLLLGFGIAGGALRRNRKRRVRIAFA